MKKSVNLTDEKRQKFHFIDQSTGRQVRMETLEAFGLKWNFVRILQGFFLMNIREVHKSESELVTARKEGNLNWERLLGQKLRNLRDRNSELFEEILEWKHVALMRQQTIPDLPRFTEFLENIPKFLHEKETAIQDMFQIRMLKELANTRLDIFVEFLTEWVKEEENSLVLLNDLAKLRGRKLVKLNEKELQKVALIN